MGKIRLMIDAGHGGTDCGCMAYGCMEKNFNRTITDKVIAKLNTYGIFDVIESRVNDNYVTISERAKRANGNNVDLVVSIHVNADGQTQPLPHDSQVKGTEIFYSICGGLSKEVANNVIQSIAEEGFITKRGIKTRVNNEGSDYYGIIRQTIAPCIIIESFFIDDADDLIFYQNRLDKFANAIAEGIFNTFFEKVDGTSESVKNSNDDKMYKVQCGAFRNKDNAINLMNELNRKGFNAFIVEV